MNHAARIVIFTLAFVVVASTVTLCVTVLEANQQ